MGRNMHHRIALSHNLYAEYDAGITGHISLCTAIYRYNYNNNANRFNGLITKPVLPQMALFCPQHLVSADQRSLVTNYPYCRILPEPA